MIEEEVANKIWDILSEESPKYTDIPKIVAEEPELDMEMLSDIINNDWDEEMVTKWYHALDFLEQWENFLHDSLEDED